MGLLDGRVYAVEYLRDWNAREYAVWARYCYLEMAVAVAERLRREGRIARVVESTPMGGM